MFDMGKTTDHKFCAAILSIYVYRTIYTYEKEGPETHAKVDYSVHIKWWYSASYTTLTWGTIG